MRGNDAELGETSPGPRCAGPYTDETAALEAAAGASV